MIVPSASSAISSTGALATTTSRSARVAVAITIDPENAASASHNSRCAGVNSTSSRQPRQSAPRDAVPVPRFSGIETPRQIPSAPKNGNSSGSKAPPLGPRTIRVSPPKIVALAG